MGETLFLSGSERDHDYIHRLARRLQLAGYTTWWFGDDQYAGLNYRVELMKRIEHCRGVVLVLSQYSVHSDEVVAEVVQAKRWNRPVYPIRLDMIDGKVSYDGYITQLTHIKAIDGRDPLPELLRALELPAVAARPLFTPHLVVPEPHAHLARPNPFALCLPPGASTPDPLTVCTIGRDPTQNMLVIQHCEATSTISRLRHASITAHLQPDGEWIFMLHPISTNSTFLNRVRITEPVRLSDGALIELPLKGGGRIELGFSYLSTTEKDWATAT
ncbi:MAG: hypothetical protein OHK0015_30730 [Chloroflexi bacterium OHK40]